MIKVFLVTVFIMAPGLLPMAVADQPTDQASEQEVIDCELVSSQAGAFTGHLWLKSDSSGLLKGWLADDQALAKVDCTQTCGPVPTFRCGGKWLLTTETASVRVAIFEKDATLSFKRDSQNGGDFITARCK